jgi:uncharacterized protein YqgC (DUF456 family)
MEQLAWVMGGFLILIGVAGCVLPVLPGFGLIFVGALLHKLVIPDGLSWWMVGLAVISGRPLATVPSCQLRCRPFPQCR